MKLLLCSRVEDIDVLKGMIEQEGIACEVTNYTAPIPGAEFYPKLWVEDNDFAKASSVLSAFRSRRLESQGLGLAQPVASSWKNSSLLAGSVELFGMKPLNRPEAANTAMTSQFQAERPWPAAPRHEG